MTSTFSTTHPGLERVISTVSATKALLNQASKQRHHLVLAAITMAVVTLTERALDAVKTGFVLEWVVLSGVALLTVLLLANVVKVSLDASTVWISEALQNAKAARAETKMWQLAKFDARVMAEIRHAQSRAERVTDEPFMEERPAAVNMWGSFPMLTR
jgi:hypothetical protein